MQTALRAIHTALYGRVTSLGSTCYYQRVPDVGGVPAAPPYVVMLGGPEVWDLEVSDSTSDGSASAYALRVDARTALAALDLATTIVNDLTTNDLSVTGFGVVSVDLVSMVPISDLSPGGGGIHSVAITLRIQTVPAT